MRPIPPMPRSTRLHRGPMWLSRSLIVSTAVWLVLLGAALGAVFALAQASHEIRLQRFVELDFTRSCFIVLERSADQGVLDGALTALWFLILALLVSAYAPVRALFDPRELAELLVDRDRLLRAQLAIAVAFLIVGFARAYTGSGLARAQAYLLALLALFGIAALAVIARALRRSIRANDEHALANAFAACGGMAVIVTLGFAVNHERIWRPFAWDALAGNFLLLSGAWATYQLTRRAVIDSSRSHAPAGRGALGGGLVRAALVVAILPALAPLLVRAAATIFGHSGVTPATPFNVIVIGVDCLRADAVDLSPPGEGERDRTPNLRNLAQRGVRFTQAISQSPWTLPAFASMFTGKYPLEHGAVSLGGILRARELTLPEILREAGYRTGAFVASEYTASKRGFDQGQDEFGEEFVLPANAISSQGITNQSIDFIERHSGAPFFLFAQYSDPHSEYRDHEGWTWADGYAGWLRDQNDIDNLVRNRNLVGEADLQWLRDLYDEEVAYTDSEIGRLFTALEKSGVQGRTIVALVAGNGEEFLDHGNFSHATTLYEELLHVPMILAMPEMEGAGTRRADVVETRSLFSTVLDRLGIDFAARSRPRGLFSKPASAPGTPESAGGDSDGARAFSMVWLPDAQPKLGKRFEIVSLRTARWKLVHNLTRDRYELYDIAADPRETKEVSGEHAQEFAELRVELDLWLEEQSVYASDLPGVAAAASRRKR